MKPLSFLDVHQAHNDVAGRTGPLKDLSLQEFAQLGNALTNSKKFEAGDTNAFGQQVKKASTGIDHLLELSGLNREAALLGKEAGRVIGKEQLGAQVGSAIPRGVINTIPLILSGGVAGFAGAAALASGDTFNQTNSKSRAALAGAASVVAPIAIGKITPAIGGKLLGQATASKVGAALTAKQATGTISRFTGNLLDSFVVDTAAELGDIALAGDERSFSEIATTDFWAAQALGNLAFSGLDAKQAFQAQRTSSAAANRAQALADTEALNTSPDLPTPRPVQNLPGPNPANTLIPRPTPVQLGSLTDSGPIIYPGPRSIDTTSHRVNSVLGEHIPPNTDIQTPLRLENSVEVITDAANQAGIIPTDIDGYRTQLRTVNDVRQLGNKLPVNDTVFANLLLQADRANLGNVVDSADITLQKLKNESVLELDNTNRTLELGEVDDVISTLKDNTEGLDPAAVKTFESRLLKNSESPEYLNQALTEFTAWKAGNEPPARLAARLDNAKKRVKRIESTKPKQKSGRKNKVKDDDFSDVFTRVAGLGETVSADVNAAFSDFLVKSDSISLNSTVTNRGAKVLHNWLNLKGEPNLAKLKTKFALELNSIKLDENKKRKKFKQFDEHYDHGEDSTRSSFESFESDYNGDSDLDTTFTDYDANTGETTRMANRTLLRDGNTPGFAQALAPEVARVVRIFEKLTGQNVEVGKLINPEGSLAGLSSRSSVQNVVFLDPKLSKTSAKFVAAHEILGHQFKKLFEAGQLDPRSTKSYGKALEYVKDLSVEHRAQLLNQLAVEFLPKKLQRELKDTFDNTSGSVDETISNLSGILAFASTSKADLSGVLRFIPQRLYDFAVASMKFLRESARGVKSFVGVSELRGAKVSSLKEISDFKDLVTKASNDLELADVKAQSDFANMDRATFGGMGRAWSALEQDGSQVKFAGNEAVDLLADAMFFKTRKTTKKVISDFGEGIIHKLERFPALKEVAQALRGESYHKHAIQRTVEAMLYADGVKPGGKPIVPKDLGSLGRVYKDSKSFEALNEIQLYQNKEDVSIFDLRESDPNKFNSLLQGLDEGQRGDVLESLARFQRTTKHVQDEILHTNVKNEIYNLASILRDKMDGTNAQVLETSQKLFEAFEQGPTQFDIYAKQLGIDPEVPGLYLKTATEALNKKRELFKDRSFFVTERRMKRFQVSYTRNPKNPRGRRDFDTVEQATEFVAQLRKDKVKVHYGATGYKDSHGQHGGNYKRAGKFDELLDAAADKTTGTLLQDLLDQGKIDIETFESITKSHSQFKSALDAEQLNLDINNTHIKREFRDGREDLNFIDQHLSYLTKLSQSLPKAHTDAVLRFESKNPKIVGDERNSTAFKDAERGLNNFRTPDSELGNAITKGNFLHFLAGNVSSALLEATQAPVNLSPKLIEEGAGLVDAYTKPVAAAESIAKFNLSGRWKSGKTVQVGGKKVDLYEMLINKAEKEGQIGLGLQQEVADAGNTMRDLGRMSLGHKSLGRRAWDSTGGNLLHMGTALYGLSTGFNAKIALISALEIKRKQLYGKKTDLTKAEFDNLYQEATRISGIANSSFGRLDRPVGLFEGNRTAAQAMYSLGSFNSGMFSNLFRYAQKGFGKNLDGYTKAERKSARKAAYTSVIGLMTMAGAIGGIPLAGPIVALIENNTEREPQAWLREMLFDLGKEIGGTNEAGTFTSDLGAHGLTYALGAPMDYSSRVSVGGLLGFNSFEGWSAKALLGPTLGRAQGYGEGIKSVFEGDVAKGLSKILPVGLGKLVSAHEDNGNITDHNGQHYFEATTSERVFKAIGFNTSREVTLKDAKRLTSIQTRNRQARNAKLVEQLTETYQDKGLGAAQQLLAEYVQQNQGYNRDSAIRGLKQNINQRRDGFDPRLGGALQGAEARSNLLDTFNPAHFPNQSAVRNLQSDLQVGAQFGQAPTNVNNRVTQAGQLDFLRGQSNLPVPALNQLVSNLTNPQAFSQAPDLLSAFANSSRRFQ